MTVIATLSLILAAPNLSGVWEFQTLGADRLVQIEHKDSTLTVHRVMHPEFEGETYRLEHLYQGTIEGEAIHGALFVKEETLPDFENLRPFTGSLTDDSLVIDGRPLERVEQKTAEVAMLPVMPKRPMKKNLQRRLRRPRRPRGVERGKTSKKTNAPPTTIAEGTENAKDDPVDLYDSILGGGPEPMTHVSRELDVELEASPEDLVARGIDAFRSGNYPDAFDRFDEAIKAGAQASVHRWLGLAAEKLGKSGTARDALRQAVRLDPSDAEAREAYERVKERKTIAPQAAPSDQ